jgi:hypothetical protein
LKRGLKQRGAMAIVNEVTAETIERLRGVIDFYMLRGILPVARSWPKKPKPPYTDLQAEYMEAFAIANKSMRELKPNILKEWRAGSVGKRACWTDVYRGIVIDYWKLNRGIPPIALDYNIIDTGNNIQVEWEVLQRSLKGKPPDKYYELKTIIISKADIEKVPGPIYFTLKDKEGSRFVAPYIKYK